MASGLCVERRHEVIQHKANPFPNWTPEDSCARKDAIPEQSRRQTADEDRTVVGQVAVIFVKRCVTAVIGPEFRIDSLSQLEDVIWGKDDFYFLEDDEQKKAREKWDNLWDSPPIKLEAIYMTLLTLKGNSGPDSVVDEQDVLFKAKRVQPQAYEMLCTEEEWKNILDLVDTLQSFDSIHNKKFFPVTVPVTMLDRLP